MNGTTDAIIIGGGPAGTMTAIHLADLGWAVVLVEKDGRGRPKTCGGCLNPGAVKRLHQVGLLEAVRGIARGSTRRFQVHSERGGELSLSIVDRQGEGAGLIVMRDEFDQLLIDEASRRGVRVIQPGLAAIQGRVASGTVVGVSDGSHELEFHVPLVIGADGLRSKVAGTMGLSNSGRIGRKYGFAFELESPRASLIERDTIEMFVGVGGYLGIVNVGGGCLHLAGLVSRGEKSTGTSPADMCCGLAEVFEMLRLLGLHRLTNQDLRGLQAAGPMPCRPRRVADDRSALVGDAAGYLEPFTGEGMLLAMMGAETLKASLAHVRPGTWNARTASCYRSLFRRRLSTRLRVCSVLSSLLGRPALFDALLRLTPGRRILAQRLLDQVVST